MTPEAPATTANTVESIATATAAAASATTPPVAAMMSRESYDIHVLVARRGRDLRRCQPDPLVHDLDTGVARRHRDLLRTVGMAVESRLADEQTDWPARLVGELAHVGAHFLHLARRRDRD